MVSRNKRIVAAFAAVAAMGMGLAGCGSDTAGDTKLSLIHISEPTRP